MGFLCIEKVRIEKRFNQKVISYCYFRLLNKLWQKKQKFNDRFMKKVAYSALYSLLYLLGLIILYLIIGYIVEKLYGYPQQSSDAYLLYNPFVVVGKTMKAYIVGLIVSINILVYLFISKRMDKFLFIPFFTISAMLLTIFVYALFF